MSTNWVLKDYTDDGEYLATKADIRPLQFNKLSYVLRRQEMSHFGIKKKLKNVGFFIFKIFF